MQVVTFKKKKSTKTIPKYLKTPGSRRFVPTETITKKGSIRAAARAARAGQKMINEHDL
jgi:CRISPR/Cas system CSM-associated protein Csm5 (group 7 of RAMP superfamily)